MQQKILIKKKHENNIIIGCLLLQCTLYIYPWGNTQVKKSLGFNSGTWSKQLHIAASLKNINTGLHSHVLCS